MLCMIFLMHFDAQKGYRGNLVKGIHREQKSAVFKTALQQLGMTTSAVLQGGAPICILGGWCGSNESQNFIRSDRQANSGVFGISNTTVVLNAEGTAWHMSSV